MLRPKLTSQEYTFLYTLLSTLTFYHLYLFLLTTSPLLQFCRHIQFIKSKFEDNIPEGNKQPSEAAILSYPAWIFLSYLQFRIKM